MKQKPAFKNKTVLITGAANGIGKSAAEYLNSKGFRIIIADIENSSFEESEEYSFMRVTLDITDIRSITTAFNKIKSSIQGLDGLINNAGIFNQFPLVEAPDDAFKKLMNTNVFGMYKMVKTFFPLIYKRKGRIINISSETAKALLPFQTYGMSKNMMETISNMLRLELNSLGIPLSLIRPGGHATSLMDKTMKVLNRIPENSYFREELLIIQKEGSKRILEVKNDPIDVAKVIYKALTDSNPRNIYNVNVSFLYKLLSLMPPNLREYLVLRALKK